MAQTSLTARDGRGKLQRASGSFVIPAQAGIHFAADAVLPRQKWMTRPSAVEKRLRPAPE